MKHLPLVLSNVLFLLFVAGFTIRHYRQRNGPIQILQREICIGCRETMTKRIRLTREDGYCSDACKKMDVTAINALAVARLEDDYERLKNMRALGEIQRGNVP